MAKIIKGESRGRPGRWLVDYYDAAGKRRLATTQTRDEAKIVLERVLGEARQQLRPVVDPNITVGSYSERWFSQVEVTAKPGTLESYKQNYRLHIAPTFSAHKIRSLHRAQIRQWLVERLQAQASRGTVKLLLAIFRTLLSAAVMDGVIAVNPAAGLGRQLKLVQNVKAHQDKVEAKALSREQLSKLLDWCETASAVGYTLFLVMARTGLRISEAIGLEWKDIDIAGREIRVARAISHGRLGTPKSGHGRLVDLSDQTAEALQRHLIEQKKAALVSGRGAVSQWVFSTEDGRPATEDRIRRAFARALAGAGLPGHLTVHSLRHTFASLLLQQGESPAYVQRQLGHASIQLTVDTYGRWLPAGNKAAVNRLDDQGGSRMVTGRPLRRPIPVEVSETIENPCAASYNGRA
jgi:integrase